MTQLSPYISHTLQAPDGEQIQYCGQGPSGMIIIDAEGHIEFISYAAKNLLDLVCHPKPSVQARDHEKQLLTKLAQLCSNLGSICQGKHAEPPSWSYTNGRGCFIFRAYWLDQYNTESSGKIGMAIEHHEPLKVKLLRALEGLPLSPTQKQVALLLAEGLSNETIGQQLTIKPSTVKDHVGKIFNKLELHHREELLPLLLAREQKQPIQLD